MNELLGAGAPVRRVLALLLIAISLLAGCRYQIVESQSRVTVTTP